jgi:hypothetical protein
MKTLTIDIPDSLDPAAARWEIARSLYEKSQITLEEGAKMVGLAPTYFKMRLEGMITGVKPIVSHQSNQPFDPKRAKKLAAEMAIQESWEELVSMIGK